MEAIKITDNLEFDVIYADGQRKHIQEGILYEPTSDGDIIFHKGTDRIAVILAAAEAMMYSLVDMKPGVEALCLGLAVTEEGLGILKRFYEIYEILVDPEDLAHRDHSRRMRQQATFRLGQMDMQASIADMLQAMAHSAKGVIGSTLADAADAVRKMEVPK